MSRPGTPYDRRHKPLTATLTRGEHAALTELAAAQGQPVTTYATALLRAAIAAAGLAVIEPVPAPAGGGNPRRAGAALSATAHALPRRHRMTDLAVDRLLNVRATLRALCAAPRPDDSALLAKLDTAIAALMLVVVTGHDGTPNLVTTLSECFPDDAEGIAAALDGFTAADAVDGGGGADAAYRIIRWRAAAAPTTEQAPQGRLATGGNACEQSGARRG
jgi:hypothetical protein